MFRAFTLLLSTILFPSTLSQAFLQVPCEQTFDQFTKNLEVDCTSPCEVVCHAGCNQTFSPDQITGYLYYTTSTPICYAALFQGATTMDTGGSFAIRSSGQMTGFVSGKSKVGEGNSRSSDTPHFSWFIEPYERVRFIQEPVDTTVKLGEYLTITCRVNDRSRAKITWYNNGKTVPWSTTSHCKDDACRVDCNEEVCMIQHAEKTHAGTWWCEVTTDYSGTLVSRHVTVTVAYLNSTFIYQPQRAIGAYMGHGGTLKLLPGPGWPRVLPCSVDSKPPAQITWYKNSQVVEERNVFQAQDGSLYFLSESEKDSGSYKCTAYNSVTNETITSNSKRIQREAQAIQPGPEPSAIISSISTSTVFARPGETVTLTCVARGNPIPAISWSVPPSVSSSDRSSSPNYGRNFVITSFQKSDAGEYRCNALNVNDYDDTGSSFITKVIMVRKPDFSIVPNDQTHNPGDDVVLRCGLQGRGWHIWLKNGQTVLVSSNVRMENDFLVIRNVGAEDVGMYQCVAGYMNDRERYVNQASAYLSVRSPPQLTQPNSKELIHDAGLSVWLKCTAIGYPYPYVSWYKDGSPLEFDGRIRMVDVQSIRIDRANGLDYGDYTCVARNSLGSVNLTRTLTIIEKANIVSLQASDERGYYLSGDKISISCIAAGSKTDFSITWRKDNSDDLGNGVGIREENEVDLYDYQITKSVLEIPVSNTLHEGNYRCLARNYLGLSDLSIPIKVYPKAISPRLESGPIHTVISDENNMLVTCTFSGAPPPWVTWKKNGEVIESDRIRLFYSEEGLVSNLLISDAVRADSGNYTCQGQNSAGYTAEGELSISIHFSNTGGVKNGTSSTRGLMFTLPVLFLWLLFV